MMIFTLILLMTISPSLAEDYSKMSTNELHDIQKSIRSELLKRDLVIGNKTRLFEQDGVSLYLTGDYKDTLLGFQLNVIIINDSDKKISICPEDTKVSVNGWEIPCMTNTQVNAGKKLKGYFVFNLENADIISSDDIEEIELRLYIYDHDNYTRISTLEPIIIQFPL